MPKTGTDQASSGETAKLVKADKAGTKAKAPTKTAATAQPAAAKTTRAKPAAKPAVKPAARPDAVKTAGAKTASGKATARTKSATGGEKATRAKAPSKLKPPEAEAAPAPAAVPASAVGPNEENPLHKKLRLRAEDKGVVIAPPRDGDNPLLPLPDGFLVLEQAGDLADHEGRFDYIHVFARDRADLIEHFSLLRDRLAPGGSLWVSWLKQSSARRGGGQFGDLNENVVRRLGLTHALVDVKVAALDRDWSALRLVHRRR
jgi:hypothetical protein